MWFPKFSGLSFGRFLAAVCQRWERTQREHRLAQVRSRRRRRSWDCRGALVQVLEPRTMLTIDLGDAPSPYPTTLAENGSRHTDIGLTLGATRDSELDGTHSAGATADGADEDGVTLGTIQVGALGATVTVNVQGAGGKLDAWIDFNGDGNWGGAGEQIFASQSVVVGNNNLTFDVPSFAKDGPTFARFRLSTAGNLGPEGLAADGEVEDYAVTITLPATASGVFGGQNFINAPDPDSDPFNVTNGNADGACSMFVADVDGDGDMDMLSASRRDDKIAWYENDGNQNFTAHTINTPDPDSPGGGANGNADEVRSVFAADMDGDGDLDVLSASINDDKIAWYENDGSQNFTAHTISTVADSARSVTAADVDGDGDIDVLSASILDDKIAWYENDGSQNFTAHTISSAADTAYSVSAADVDGDGDLDVLSASFMDDKITWYENDGSQNFTAHTISSAADGAASVIAADVDGDGDIDVLSASFVDDKIAWYENDGNQTFTAHTISTALVSAISVFAADVDGDGDMDMLSASANDDKIAWYENDGSQNFTAHTISTAADRAYSAFAADVDGDGDLDVLSASFSDDKIAWYENLHVWDFGDAPVPYPTTLAENGARHELTGPKLGATRDGESDGTHSANADADGADEGGVTLGTIQVGALGATATVNVAGALVGAKLDAWIDFNGDGNWGGPGEQIASSVAVVNGVNTITFDVPSFAKAGTTFARFRLSTAGNLGPEGLAADGEVEDYAVTIIPPVATLRVLGGQNTVTTGANGAFGVAAADVDGDGDMDLLSASPNDDKLAWYENNGSQNFTAHTISTAADEAKSVTAADVDGDGDLDVLSASTGDDEIAWYENDGTPAVGGWTAHTISTASDGAWSVTTADVDGDGDLDVLSASRTDDEIAWYENDGSQNFTAHTISTAANGAYSVTAADVDGDGDLDVLSASYADTRLTWYENDGGQNFTTHTISTAANGVRSVAAADVDGDGDLDVLSASLYDNKLAWYENDGNQNFTARTISTAANGAVSVAAADVDGDGDLDVLSASSFDNKIAWYENNGSQNFTAHTISAAAAGARSVVAADVDGDGDLDVLSASNNDNKVAWYQNLTAPVIGAFDAAIAYVENAAPRILDANATVTDPDTIRFNGGVLTIRLTANAEASDRLEFRPVLRLLGVSGSNLTYRGTTVASFTGGTGAVNLVITFNANATVSAVQTVLRNITYRSISSNPSILPRTVQVTLTDGTGMTSNQPTKTINVTAVPIPPVGGAPSTSPNTSNQSSSPASGPFSATTDEATFSSFPIITAASTNDDLDGGNGRTIPSDGDLLFGRRKRRRSL